MKYFKIHIGFNHSLSIDETELEKAIYAQITGKVFIGKSGTVSGNSITMILSDYNRSMGWNDGYKLGPEDYSEVKKKFGSSLDGYVGEIKEKIEYLIKNGMENLIGSNISLPRDLELIKLQNKLK